MPQNARALAPEPETHAGCGKSFFSFETSVRARILSVP
jgi:hypothetical protein